MLLDFQSMTSDQLRAEIARGNFPPIAGADDGAVEEAAPEADLSNIIEEAVHEEQGQQIFEPEVPATPEAEETPEAPEGAAEEQEEAEEAPDPIEQYNLALEIATDPTNEQYDLAVEILEQNGAPRAAIEALANVEPEEMVDFDDEEDDILGDDATGIPQIDNALREMREFQRDQEASQTQAQQQAEQEQAEAAAQAFAEDFQALSGVELADDISSMSPQEQAIAITLLGADGIAGVEDPKEFVENMFKERDAAVVQAAIDEFAKGKGEYRPTPITERSASTNAGNIHTPAEAASTIEGIIRQAATPANGVSG